MSIHTLHLFGNQNCKLFSTFVEYVHSYYSLFTVPGVGLPAATQLWPRLSFYTCLWFCSHIYKNIPTLVCSMELHCHLCRISGFNPVHNLKFIVFNNKNMISLYFHYSWIRCGRKSMVFAKEEERTIKVLFSHGREVQSDLTYPSQDNTSHYGFQKRKQAPLFM